MDLAAAGRAGAGIYWLERQAGAPAALVVMATAVTAAVIALKLVDLPAIDRAVFGAAFVARRSPPSATACASQSMHRSWRYGLNYYSVTPLPDCSQSPRPLQVWQEPGRAPDRSLRRARSKRPLTRPIHTL